jgi:hypothetical protein
MSFVFSCSSCQASLQATPEQAGTRVRCLHCGNVFRLEAAEPPLASNLTEKRHRRRPEQADGGADATPTKSRARTARAPAPRNLPYRPVAPKFARLDAQEQHLYTFTLQPMFFTSFWSAFWRMGVGYGWQPDYARFVAHFTDQRILVESYDFSAKEKLASKGFYALAKSAVKKMAALAPTGAAYNAVMGEEGELLKQMLNRPPEWFVIDYTEIATVGRQGFGNPIQNFAAKLFGRSLVRLTFEDPDREDLVFVTCAAKAGAFSFKDCNKAFIAEMRQLLKEKGRLPSERGGKQRKKKGAATKRRKAEEPARNPGIKVLGCLGFFLGMVLLFAGAFSGQGILLLLGTVVMFGGFAMWQPWGKDRKIASAWREAKGTRKSGGGRSVPPPLPPRRQEVEDEGPPGRSRRERDQEDYYDDEDEDRPRRRSRNEGDYHNEPRKPAPPAATEEPSVVQCPHCDKRLPVPARVVGKTVHCPACGGAVDTFVQLEAVEPPPTSRDAGTT